MRYLICGDREWTNKERIKQFVKQLIQKPTVIIGNLKLTTIP